MNLAMHLADLGDKHMSKFFLVANYSYVNQPQIRAATLQKFKGCDWHTFAFLGTEEFVKLLTHTTFW